MSTERVTSAIRDCLASGTALRISGRGTWLDAGRPVRAGNALSLAEDAGVVSYVPGDLTLTVRAGTTLSEIASTRIGNSLSGTPYRQFEHPQILGESPCTPLP